MDKLKIEQDILKVLKNIYDPEIPVNIYDLGLIYEIIVSDDAEVEITMTLTAPNCPVADELIEQVKEGVKEVSGIKDVNIKLTFEPSWDMNYLSEEAKLELGML
ncbi:MAG: iron-sulfur cluster assembly protein [Prevotellaceae bacterium]|jgi:FeS assembly SUF system protein|nr:iron-sulfur cluster assembly protein [Prevotellaceae bacterium]